MRRKVVLACSLILLGLMSTPAADDKIKDSPYYPLKVGTKWTYKVGTNSFNMQVTKHEKVGEVLCGVIETSKDGNVVLTEYVGVKDDGVYRFSPAGDKVDAYRVLKLPPKKGDSWKVELKMGGQVFKGAFKVDEAEITVPAGKYKTFVATSDGFEVTDPNGNQLKLVLKSWFAEKVGLVKNSIKLADKPEVIVELEKFESK
jgi:hypothetical protein